MNHPKPILTFILAAIAFVVVGYLIVTIFKDQEAATPPAPAAEATAAPQPTAMGVGAIGRIEPRSRVLALSHDQGPEGARIQQVMVSEGQEVQQGDVLVLFSDFDRRQSERDAATARFKATEARLPSFDAELRDASADFERHKKLLESGAISKSAYDQARNRYNKAAAAVESAKLDIDTLRAEADLAEKKLQQSQLRAPMAGTVLKIHRWPGERVSDSAIMDFADLTQMDVVAEVYENDIGRIKPNQTAEVILPGMPKTYSATVREQGFIVRKNDLSNTDPLADRDNRIIEVRLTLGQDAIADLKNQIYRQVQVQIKP